jgi:hypothetical protein
VLGVLLMLGFGGRQWSRRSALVIGIAPVLAIAASWITQGHFPIRLQVLVVATAAALGAVAGLALRKNVVAAVAAIVLTGGLFAWGTATGISGELDTAARAAGRHVLDAAGGVPDGDAGFVKLLEIAFAFAEQHSQGGDPVLPNEAAVLALGVILGDEHVASVARRHLDPARLPEAKALRSRITVQGRKDWPNHFWVSAGLTVLSDADRSIAVGITKELMDAEPGGSGFSFTDLAADAAGNRFARAATRDADSARAMQARIRTGLRLEDVVPELRDLPEGIPREDFQRKYGGLGGPETTRIVDEIKRRLAACRALQ